jgi:hypothetical protein
MDLDSEPIRRVIAAQDPDEDLDSDGASLIARMRVGRTVFPRSTSPESPDSFRYKPDPLKRPAAIRRREATECFHYMVNMPTGVVETLKSSKDLSKLLEQHVELKFQGVQFEPAIAAEKASVTFLSS